MVILSKEELLQSRCRGAVESAEDDYDMSDEEMPE